MNRYILSNGFKEDLLKMVNLFKVEQVACPFKGNCANCVICEVLLANNISTTFEAIANKTEEDIDRIMSGTKIYITENDVVIFEADKKRKVPMGSGMYRHLRNFSICRL